MQGAKAFRVLILALMQEIDAKGFPGAMPSPLLCECDPRD